MSITTTAGIVRTHASERPDAVAISYQGRILTWADLDRRANRVAQALAAEGVTSQDRVAFIDKNGPEYWRSSPTAPRPSPTTSW